MSSVRCDRCQRELSTEAVKCPSCREPRWPRGTNAVRWGFAIGTGIIVLMFLVLLTGRTTTSPTGGVMASIAAMPVLRATAVPGTVPLFISNDLPDTTERYLTAHKFSVEQGTRVRVVETSFWKGVVRIEILEGPHTGREGWTKNTWVENWDNATTPCPGIANCNQSR